MPRATRLVVADARQRGADVRAECGAAGPLGVGSDGRIERGAALGAPAHHRLGERLLALRVRRGERVRARRLAGVAGRLHSRDGLATRGLLANAVEALHELRALRRR